MLERLDPQGHERGRVLDRIAQTRACFRTKMLVFGAYHSGGFRYQSFFPFLIHAGEIL
jgi:hypothetical protein